MVRRWRSPGVGAAIALAVACDARRGTHPVDGPAGAPLPGLQLGCDAGPASARYAAPIRWAPVSEEWLAFVAWFDESPYDAAPGRTSPGIRALAVHDGRLHVGVGDSAHNPGSLFCPDRGGRCPHADAPGHGLPVYVFDQGSTPTWDHVVRTEVVRALRVLGDRLLVPAADPTEGDGRPACAGPEADPGCPEERARPHPSFERATVSVLDGGTWTTGRLDRALHVLDVAQLGDELFAVGSGIRWPDLNGSDATIWRSTDQGATWSLDFAHRARWALRNDRLWAAVTVGDRLFALGRSQPGSPPADVSVVRRDGGWAWAPGFLLGFGEDTAAVPFDARSTFVFGRHLEDGRARAAVVRLRPTGDLDTELVAPLDGWEPVAAVSGCGELLVLARAWPATTPPSWAVLRSHDLRGFHAVASWESAATYTSLASWRGRLALGDDQGWLHLADPME